MAKINEEFIKYLEDYLEENECYNENLSIDDDKDSLNYLYDQIEKYAKENFIYSVKDEFGRHYTMGYNKDIYKLGYMVGQGAFFFIKKTGEEKMFDLEDLMEDKLTNPKANELKEKLEMIKKLASEISEDVEEWQIKEEIHKVYSK